MDRYRRDANNQALSGLEVFLYVLPPDATNVFFERLTYGDIENLQATNLTISRSPALNSVLEDPFEDLWGKKPYKAHITGSCQRVIQPDRMSGGLAHVCGWVRSYNIVTKYCEVHPGNSAFEICQRCTFHLTAGTLAPFDTEFPTQKVCESCATCRADEMPKHWRACECDPELSESIRSKMHRWICEECVFDPAIVLPDRTAARNEGLLPEGTVAGARYECPKCHSIGPKPENYCCPGRYIICLDCKGLRHHPLPRDGGFRGYWAAAREIPKPGETDPYELYPTLASCGMNCIQPYRSAGTRRVS